MSHFSRVVDDLAAAEGRRILRRSQGILNHCSDISTTDQAERTPITKHVPARPHVCFNKFRLVFSGRRLGIQTTQVARKGLGKMLLHTQPKLRSRNTYKSPTLPVLISLEALYKSVRNERETPKRILKNPQYPALCFLLVRLGNFSVLFSLGW